jgi:hypothetical protein
MVRSLLFCLFFYFIIISSAVYAQNPIICPPAAAPNLVTNGTFEAGMDGTFFTDFTQKTGTPPSVNPSEYTVYSNPNLTNSFFANMTDHTAAGTQMLIVDANNVNGSDVYRTNVTVAANTTYFFSSWFANINTNTGCALCQGIYFENSPILRFSINGVQVGPVIRADSATHNWTQFFASWNSGALAGPVTIRIENLQLGNGNGNDLALDDISFSTSCAGIANVGTYGRSSILPDTIYSCNEPFPLTLNPQLNAARYTFQWKNSAGALLAAPNTGSTYTFAAAPTAGKYYLCYDSIGDNVTCPRTDSVIFISQLNVNLANVTLCDPINYSINTNITAPGVNFAWTRNGTPIGGNTSSLAATDIGTYAVTVTKAGCPNATDNMVISRVTPTMIGSGTYCNTVVPNVATFSVKGGNKINNLLDLDWYTGSTGGGPVGTVVNDSTISVAAPNYVSVPGCNYGLYVQDNNAFNTSVGHTVNLANVVKQNPASTKEMIRVTSSSLTITSVNVYQWDNDANPGTSCFSVKIYSNNAAGNRCGPVGNMPNAAVLYSSTSVCFPRVATATLRTVPVNITLPGAPAPNGILYWMEIAGPDPMGFINQAATYPVNNTPGAQVISIADNVTNNCPQTQIGNIARINATAGLTNSCGRMFVCASTLSCPAPVEFIAVDAKSNISGILVSWSTAVEVNNHHFVVERSINGTNFEEIGTIKGKGNSTDISSYSFLDKAELHGQVYYRIRQVDTDGQSSYSTTVSVNSESANRLMVYPVPAKQGQPINFKLENYSGKLTVKIYSMLGALVHSEIIDLNGLNEFSLTLPLAKGVYSAELTGSNTYKKFGRIIIE